MVWLDRSTIRAQLRAHNQLPSNNLWRRWLRDHPKTNPESYQEGIWTRCICMQIPSPRFWTMPMTPCTFFTHVFQKRIYNCRAFLASSEYGQLKNNKRHSELNCAKAALSQLWNGSFSHKRRQNESSHSPTLPEPRNGPYQTSISHTCWSAAKADITSASVNPRCVKDASLFFDDLLFCTGLITAWTNASKSGTTRGCSGVVQQQTCLYTQSCKQKYIRITMMITSVDKELGASWVDTTLASRARDKTFHSWRSAKLDSAFLSSQVSKITTKRAVYYTYVQ